MTYEKTDFYSVCIYNYINVYVSIYPHTCAHIYVIRTIKFDNKDVCQKKCCLNQFCNDYDEILIFSQAQRCRSCDTVVSFVPHFLHEEEMYLSRGAEFLNSSSQQKCTHTLQTESTAGCHCSPNYKPSRK